MIDILHKLLLKFHELFLYFCREQDISDASILMILRPNLPSYLPLLVVTLLSLFGQCSAGEYRIRNIYIDQHNIFTKAQEDSVFGASLLNSLHTTTRQYLIEDELLMEEGELLDMDYVEETERNLRNTGLFKRVYIQIDTVSDSDVDITIVAQERWTTLPFMKLQTGGDNIRFGGGLKEKNLAGIGLELSAQAVNRTENDIGWEGELGLSQRRLFRSEFNVTGRVFSNRVRTEQTLSVDKPFRTSFTRTGFHLGGYNIFGGEFYYPSPDNFIILPIHQRKADAWYSLGFIKNDRYFITGYISADNIYRGDPAFRHALDNSGRILIGFSSLSGRYVRRQFLNSSLTEDVQIGAWGTAVLGKIIPIGSKGEQLYYTGGQVQQSFMPDSNLYLFAQVSAGSGFDQSTPRYTYEEFQGVGYYQLRRALFTARVRQQTVWNWSAFHQLILDNDAGLRGYPSHALIGDNRILANIEMRVFPDWEFWLFSCSGVAFYDVGTVWNQGQSFSALQFHHSAGFGLRIHDRVIGNNNMFRLDIPYNFDRGGLGQIIISAGQLFSVFKNHQYEAPKVFGEDVDVR